MVDRPSKTPRWASNNVISPVTGINNVVEPPESKKNVGWQTFEPPARQFFNWLARTTYEWILYLDDRITNRSNTTTGTGTALISQTNVLVELTAVDSSAPANYLKAVGYRAAGTATLTVTSSNVLTLGAAGADGSQAISGGTAGNIIVHVSMQKV